MTPDNQPADRISRISTNWGQMFQAHGGAGDSAAEARRALVRRYCGAVYRYLLAAVRDEAAADELSQEFALRFLRGDFQNADPGRGRFRDFLKTALYHLIVDHRRREQARPRPLPSGSALIPAAAPAEADMDREFLAQWRGELLARTWEALAASEARDRHQYHIVLRARAESPGLSVQELAARLSERLGRPITEAALRQTLHRAREKFAELLRKETARSLETDDPDRLADELIVLGLHAYCQPRG